MPPALPPRSWQPDVHRALTRLLDAPPAAPIAVFDWDDTVLEGDLSLASMRYMDATQGTRWHDTYFALLDAHGRDVAYPQITQWFAGHTPASLADLADRILAHVDDVGVPRFRPEMVDLIRALQAGGWDIWVVTASPGAIVERMAARLDIPAAHVLGMRLETDEDGRFTETVVPPATFCEGKADAIAAHVPGRPTLVAGDSRSDAPMLDLAQHALLIHGHDADLLHEAREKGWWVQTGWHHTPPESSVRTEPSP